MMSPAASEIAELVAGEGKIKCSTLLPDTVFLVSRLLNEIRRRTSRHWIGPTCLQWQLRMLQKFGVADRHTTLPGDAFEVPLGGPYDLILVTNFFHHFDPPTCEKLMRRFHAALAPGGRCVTLEFVPNDDRVSPPVQASFRDHDAGVDGCGRCLHVLGV